MESLPFTSAQFFQVFSDYNYQIWPAQLALNAVALAIVWAALKYSARRTGVALALLGCLWLWAGVVYHWLHFTSINRAAYLFGALFVIEAVLLWAAAAREKVGLEFHGDATGTAGALIVFGALIAYPVLGVLAGHSYLGGPTLGAPCPVTIFTFGMLLWVRGRVPWLLLIIPLFWALVGSMAIVAFGVRQDMLMPVAAVAVLILLAMRRAPATVAVPEA